MLYFFFFKQKTAYEMRISDWSSDVCSSDLIARLAPIGGLGKGFGKAALRFAQDRGFAHAGLSGEHDAGRAFLGIVMRDIDDRLDRVPRFFEIDPEGGRQRWRGRSGAHVRSCNQSSSLSSATGFQSMGGFSGASPYRRSASVVPSPSRRFAWRRAAFVRTRARWIS